MMFKQFLFYNTEIYFILYHDFYSPSSSLNRKKPSNDDFSEGAKTVPFIF
jgi:hypothetical protein